MAGLLQSYHVLIADDSVDDRFFLRRVLTHFPRFTVAGEVGDGEEVIAYLAGRNVFADREKYPLPELVLLDLKMPKKTGFEVLQWLHTEWFPRLTVIVLSSSDLAEDVGASLALGAHGFWTKTANVDKQYLIAEEIVQLLDQRMAKLAPAARRRAGVAQPGAGKSHRRNKPSPLKHK